MNKQDEGRLRDMLEMARKVQSYIKDKNRMMLDSDQFLLFGLVKAIEIIGEAASRISQDTRDTLPEIPWKEIITMRNKIVHDYDHIDANIVWATATNNMAELIAILDTLLPPDEA